MVYLKNRPKKKEQLKIPPKIELDPDGTLIKTRLLIPRSDDKEKQLSRKLLDNTS